MMRLFSRPLNRAFNVAIKNQTSKLHLRLCSNTSTTKPKSIPKTKKIPTPKKKPIQISKLTPKTTKEIKLGETVITNDLIFQKISYDTLKRLFVLNADNILIFSMVSYCVFPQKGDIGLDSVGRGMGGLFLSLFLVEMGCTYLGLVCFPVYVVGKQWNKYKE